MKKVSYELKLTEQEERLLLQSMDSLPSLAWTIIKKANKRGDFKKKWNAMSVEKKYRNID